MRRAAGFILWAIVLLSAGLPLAWLAINFLAHPSVVAEMFVPGDRAARQAMIQGRTIALSAGAALLATLLALAPAAALARGRLGAAITWSVMAGLLVIPGPAWAYGWAELMQRTVGLVRPQSWADYLRVIVTNATAFWPIPAAAIALAWRRLPAPVLDAARLDGARRAITARLLVGPAFAGWAGAFLLAGQNLAASDLSGIVVASVAVRDTFQLGTGDQSARLASAVAVGLPGFLATAAVAVAGWIVFRMSIRYGRDEADGEMHARDLPASSWLARAAWVVLLVTLVPPIAALAVTSGGLDLAEALEAHGRDLRYGLLLAGGAGLVCGTAGLLGTITPPRRAMVVSLAAFLLGGQFLALGLIRVFTPPGWMPGWWAEATGFLYDSAPYHALAGVALFAWLPLSSAAATWGGRWRALRDMASLDGASTLQAGARVIWPLSWPGLLAASLAVAGLSLTESQAAALIVPGTPINFMLSNLHTLNYPAMAESALLMAVLCAGGTAAVVAGWLGVIRQKAKGQGRKLLCLLFPFAFCLASCERPPAPEAVWAESGTGDGQLAYPRAIAYSPADDTVWVVDKTARIQQFDAQGNFIQGFPTPEHMYGKPVGLSTDAEGNLWVADTHYYRVIVYRPDGTEWFRFGQKGVGPGEFTWPTDVLVLPDGRVLVSEYGSSGTGLVSNDRIQIFQRGPDGTITDPPRQLVGQIGSFGTGPGQFRRPQSMAMLGKTLWVTDGTNHRLLAFDLDGNLLKTLGGEAGSAPGEFRFPYGLGVDGQGRLLVSEFGNHRVQMIDPETGRSLATWGGSFGSRPGQVKYPWGMAYDSKRDRVILLDSGNDRIQVVRLKPENGAAGESNVAAGAIETRNLPSLPG